MGTKWLTGLGGVGIAMAVAACMTATDDGVGGGSAGVSEGATFDKNTLLTDRVLRDTSMSVEDIQAFLDETPYGNESVLATYTENGKTAAEILHENAVKYDINPLELLTRAQMEQGLISKKTASDEAIALAFGCGCPHSPLCSPKFEGFTNQAACAAGTLSRSMDRAVTSSGTVSGWKRGAEKKTKDDIDVTPSNAATAALYTYTPWVGEAGGGRRGVGGASLHFELFERFADAIAPASQASATSGSRDAGPDARSTRDGGTRDSGDSDPTDPETDPDPGTYDPETETQDPENGTYDPETETQDPENGTYDPETDDASDDEDLMKEGNATPATSVPPRSSNARSRSADEEDAPEATEAELAPKKKSSGGCATSGGTNGASDASLVGMGMVAATVVAKRRRARASNGSVR